MPRRPVLSTVVAAGLMALAATACTAGREVGSPGTGSTLVPSSAPPPATGGPRSRSPLPARPAVAPDGLPQPLELVTPDGRARTARLYVPSTLPVDEPAALLVALHGGTGSGAQFQRNSGFDGLAEANGFLVVYPDGSGVGRDDDRLRTWNGGRCCGRSAQEDVDDVTFLRQLVAEVGGRHEVDPGAVFAAGHSNGGIMAYRLACEASDVFAAVAVQSSSMEVDACQPERPVSAMHVHGTDDRNLPIDGGEGDRSLADLAFHDPHDAVRTLARADGCPEAPSSATDPANPDVRLDTWSPCRDGTEVRFATVAGAGHAWMGHDGPRLVGEPYPDLDTSLVLWTFLAAHARAA